MMLMKKLTYVCLITFLVSLFSSMAVGAQVYQLTVSVTRDWGYGGLNGDIEGLFSMHVSGPSNLVRVDFFIDDKLIGEKTVAPFALQFNTDNYPLGIHKLSAIGYSNNGQEYHSNVITGNFVSKQSTSKFIFPILGIVLAVIVLSALVPFLANRGKRLSIPLGAERNYGVGGGGICPKCHRPFAIPFMSAHFGFSKLAVCPFCGKMSLVRVESIATLREAEKAELGSGKIEATREPSEEEQLRKDLEDSKYQGQ